MRPDTLYHFTSFHSLKNIKEAGLTLGVIPVKLNNGQIIYRERWQWLTASMNFEQPWILPHADPKAKRDYYRLKIRFPISRRKRLFDWSHHYKRWEMVNPLAEEMNRFNDAKNWYVYSGTIPACWIREYTTHPAYEKIKGRNYVTNAVP